MNDPYVRRARAQGYRSRAAVKLAQIDDKVGILGPGRRVVDLGAAPGGWSQLAVERVRPMSSGGCVLAVDSVEVVPIPDTTILRLDVLEPGAAARIREGLGASADLVLSDMAPPATGHASTDHLRAMALLEAALVIAYEVLTPGGDFVAKVRQGGTERGVLAGMKRRFTTVKHVKPAASRPESAEIYVVALGFRTK